MKKLLAVLVAGLSLAVVSCQMLTPDGISGWQRHLNAFLGRAPGSDEAVASFKAEMTLPDPPTRTAESDADRGSADVAAAQADASDSAETSAPAGITQYYGGGKSAEVAGWNSAAEMNADYSASEASVVAAAETTAADEPVAAQPVAGVTQFYGTATASETPAWASEANANPDYAIIKDIVVAEAAPSTPGVTQYYGSATASETPAWASEASANPDYAIIEDTVVAEAEPAAEQAPGITQFYGDSGSAADAAWAAGATLNPDYTPSSAEAAPAAESAPGVTQFYGTANAPVAPAWAAGAAMNADYSPATSTAAAETDAPAAEASAPGVTQFYGNTAPSGTPAWAAGASMNADYAAAPAATGEPEPAAAAPSAPGVTQFYGNSAASGTPAWAAGAAMNSDYSAATAPAPASGRQAAVNSCRDALNTEAQSGKLLFRSGSATLKSSSKSALDKLASIAKDCDSMAIEVGGHTDNTGSTGGNQTLSQRRAEAVADYLIKAGVDASRVKAVGYGESKPIGDNKTSAGRSQNRRIEFVVIDN